MPRRISSMVPVLCLAPAALAGCLQFNEECSPPIDDPDEVVTWLAVPVPVARAVVRTRESALANAMTDSYLRAFGAGFSGPKPVVAMENAGGIRAEGLCTTRTQLAAGPLPRRVLRDTLPFANELVVVELSIAELFGVLEHGVATLRTSSPGGQFLQVSGLSYEVDCREPAEVLNATGATVIRVSEGRRVRSLRVSGHTFLRDDPPTGDRIRVAFNEFIAGGGDNFVDLAGRLATGTDRLTYNVFEEALRQAGSPDAPLTLTVDPENPRIVLRHCE